MEILELKFIHHHVMTDTVGYRNAWLALHMICTHRADIHKHGFCIPGRRGSMFHEFRTKVNVLNESAACMACRYLIVIESGKKGSTYLAINMV